MCLNCTCLHETSKCAYSKKIKVTEKLCYVKNISGMTTVNKTKQNKNKIQRHRKNTVKHLSISDHFKLT